MKTENVEIIRMTLPTTTKTRTKSFGNNYMHLILVATDLVLAYSADPDQLVQRLSDLIWLYSTC